MPLATNNLPEGTEQEEGDVGAVDTSISPSTVMAHVNDVTPTASSENDSKRTPAENSASSSSPKRLRRSNRHTNRIVLSSKRSGALQQRRMEELFFQDDDDVDLSNRSKRPSRHCRRRRQQQEEYAEEQPITLKLDNYLLIRLHSSPHIYVVDDFLRPSDLRFLLGATQKGTFQKSYVDKAEPGEGSLLDDTHRTSSFVSFTKQENAKVAAIEKRAAKLLGYYSTDQIEPLQLVRYLPGQFFGVHVRTCFTFCVCTCFIYLCVVLNQPTS